jgi:LacI family transcriptional regulator
MIGVVVPEIVHFFFSSVIKGIMEVAYQAGYKVLLCQSDEEFEKEKTNLHTLLETRIDGLLISLSGQTQTLEHLTPFFDADIPVVFFDKVGEGLQPYLEASKVTVDDWQGAFDATSHLIGQGYRRIAHIAGPLVPNTSINRLRGYREALGHHDHIFTTERVFECKHVTREEGYAYAQKALAMPHPPDAFFVVADHVALGVLKAVKDAGLRVPQDVGIVGFSNWDISDMIEPPLTTVAQPGTEMGQIAARLLIEEIQFLHQTDEEADAGFPPRFARRSHQLPTSLIVRQSSLRQSVLSPLVRN